MTQKRGPKTRPQTTAEPGPLPERPDWVTSDRAIELWEQFGRSLNQLGLLESLDAVAFGMLCEGFAAWLQAVQELSTEQLVQLVGEQHHPTQNPLVSIVRQNSKGVRELLSEFGMTPASRTQLTGSTSATRQTTAVDPLEELAKKFGSAMPPEPVPTPKRRAVRKKKRTTAKKKRVVAVE